MVEFLTENWVTIVCVVVPALLIAVADLVTRHWSNATGVKKGLLVALDIANIVGKFVKMFVLPSKSTRVNYDLKIGRR